MSLIDDSPILAWQLGQSFDREACDFIQQAFDLSKRLGGTKELGFIRPEGVSYNPRLARIALILLKDESVTDSNIIAASLLAAAGAALRDTSENLDNLEECTVALAKKALSPTTELLQECSSSGNNPPNEAALIASAMWLDRARHLHQITVGNRAKICSEFFEETNSYIELSRLNAPVIHQYLVHWKAQFARKLSSL